MATGNKCNPCDVGCATCVTNPNNCFSCQLSYYKDLNTNTCKISCPDGQYIDAINSPNVCVLCNATCATCNNTVCLTCKNGFYLDISKIHCISYCQIGEYQNTSNGKCLLCDVACASCYLEDAGSCYSCR